MNMHTLLCATPTGSTPAPKGKPEPAPKGNGKAPKASKLPVPPPKSHTSISAPKPTSTPPASADDIPTFLEVKNRVPLSPEQRAKVERALADAKASKAAGSISARSAKPKATKKAKPAAGVDTAKMPVQGRAALNMIAGKLSIGDKVPPTPTAPKAKASDPVAVAEARSGVRSNVLGELKSKATTTKPADPRSAAKIKRDDGSLAGKAKAKPAKAPKAKAKAEKPKAKAQAAKPAAKARRSSYDWDAAEIAANAGKLPTLPPFVSYAPHILDVYNFAKKGETRAIIDYLKNFKRDPCPPSRKNLFDFGALCIKALEVRLVRR